MGMSGHQELTCCAASSPCMRRSREIYPCSPFKHLKPRACFISRVNGLGDLVVDEVSVMVRWDLLAGEFRELGGRCAVARENIGACMDVETSSRRRRRKYGGPEQDLGQLIVLNDRLQVSGNRTTL